MAFARGRVACQWLLSLLIVLSAALAGGTACDEDVADCFGDSLHSGDRIAMNIVKRDDVIPGAGPYDAAATMCGPTISLNVGDTIYALVGDRRTGGRCVGYFARFDPVPSGLPPELLARGAVDTESGNDLTGDFFVQGSCEGTLDFGVDFLAQSIPIPIPAASATPEGANAVIRFTYNGRPANGGPATACPPPCNATAYVIVQLVADDGASR